MKKILVVLLCFITVTYIPSTTAEYVTKPSPEEIQNGMIEIYLNTLEVEPDRIKEYLSKENIELFVNTSKKYPSVLIAMSIIESGWGRYPIGNNYFGVKGNGHIKKTKEWDGYKYITITSEFQQYKSKEENIKAVVSLLYNKRYNIVTTSSYKEAANRIANKGYATCPTYASKVIKVIEEYNLDYLDKIKQYNIMHS